MKLGLNGEYIKTKDLGISYQLINQLNYGDIIGNAQGEFLYYAENNNFLFMFTQVGQYLKNPKGPWMCLSSAIRVDNRTPLKKIKEWLFSNF